MQLLFFQSDTTLIFALCIGYISIAGLITWIFIKENNRLFFQKYEGVVAPFFSLPAVLFSLTVALLATSVWDNYSISTKAIKNETQGILDVISIASSTPYMDKVDVAASAKAYAQSVIDDEWQTLASNRSPSSTTNDKFIKLRTDIFKAVNIASDKAESKALLNAFYTVNNARESRLAYAFFDLHPVRWHALLFLGILLLITVAFTHSSKPRALIVAMLIATPTILTPLCILALTFSSPYQGLIAISNSPFLQITQ